MKTALPLLLVLLVSAPLSAQSRRSTTFSDDPPSVALRPFFVLAGESFAAKNTFDAAFGHSFEPLFGGGLEVVLRDGIYADVTLSRFSKTGQRAFRANNQTFELGIPLTATLTPIEVTGGYRFRTSPRVFPYVGVGIGSYGYQETSNFADTGDDVHARHIGYLAAGGVDLRVHRWVGIAGEVQYTHVPGILGTGGISQAAGENDLGGVAVRVKVTVGR
jgi:opacity protein-like surface antigen